MTPEGYYNPVTANYYYYLKDHLGNNRVTYHYSGSVPVIDQEVEYYPFGSMFAANNLQNNLYLYNGKELNNEFFENYDYGARFYDPQIGRFPSMDPFADRFVELSPYNYASNDPVGCIDLWGLQGIKTNVLYGSIQRTVNEAALISSQHPEWSTARFLGSTMLNRTANMATFTDANDAVVVATTFTRGSNAVNIDGTKTTTGDKIAAFAGLLAPGVSGSTIKKAFGAISDALGITKKADNLGNPFKGKSLEQVQEGFEKQVESGKLELKYEDPVSGSRSYKNNESGYSYNVDTGISGKTGEKVENAHVDVNYPNPKPTNVDPKRKFKIEEK